MDDPTARGVFLRTRILIVEDELVTAKNLSALLSAQGFDVDLASDGAAVLSKRMTRAFDLMLLDIMLPGMSGLELLQELRRLGDTTPVVLITGRSALDDRVLGLESGADAYIVKPFESKEVVAILRSVLRRSVTRVSDSLKVGSLTIDFVRAAASRDGRRLELTPKEFQLLGLLARHEGEPMSRELISTDVWGSQNDSGTNVVDVHIRRLRSKIDDPFPKKLIHTVRGVGYMLSSALKAE